MKCLNCGNELQNDAVFCNMCGFKQNDTVLPVRQKVPGNGFATASVVLGALAFAYAGAMGASMWFMKVSIHILCGGQTNWQGIGDPAWAQLMFSLLWPAFLLAIAGAVIGTIALQKVQSAGYKTSKPKIGIMLSSIGLFISILFCVL